MNDPENLQRRKLIVGAILLPASSVVGATIPTPPASEGPFYPSEGMRFNDTDNDLVKMKDAVREAGGEVVRISGRVLNAEGLPLSGAVVEIWQCDVNGRYLHRADWGRKSRDAGFQGFGHSRTNNDGEFQFRTIQPVPYSGRTPHIHVKVWHRGQELLTTQWYLPNHPDNQRDGLYQRIPSDQRELVTLFFDGSTEPNAKIDLVV
jgi:protocatechuate 3,4-dioxygenase beta subunit